MRSTTASTTRQLHDQSPRNAKLPRRQEVEEAQEELVVEEELLSSARREAQREWSKTLSVGIAIPKTRQNGDQDRTECCSAMLVVSNGVERDKNQETHKEF